MPLLFFLLPFGDFGPFDALFFLFTPFPFPKGPFPPLLVGPLLAFAFLPPTLPLPLALAPFGPLLFLLSMPNKRSEFPAMPSTRTRFIRR